MSERRRPVQPARSALALLEAAREDHASTEGERRAVRSALTRRIAQGAYPKLAHEPAPSRAAVGNKAWLFGSCVTLAAAAALGALLHGRQVPQPAASSVQQTPTRHTSAERAQTAIGETVEPPDTLPDTSSNEPRASAPQKAKARAQARPQRGERNKDTTLQWTSAAAVSGETEAHEVGATAPRVERPQPLVAVVEQTAAARPSAEQDAPVGAPPTAAQHTSAERTAPSELVWMQRIHAALRDADLKRVLALSAEHAQRWPHGAFAQERDGVRAIAACQLQSPQAATQARAFLALYPASALSPRVRLACGLSAARTP